MADPYPLFAVGVPTLSAPLSRKLPPPASLQAVERAIGDLRRGAFVILAGNGALLMQAAEAVSRESLTRLRALSRGGPQLVLSAQRARILGLTENERGAVRLTLPGGVSAQAVQQMADPMVPPPGPLPQPLAIVAVETGQASAGAVELTKLARLLPAAVVAELPPERLSYIGPWAAAEGLLVTELDEVLAYREAEGRALEIAGEANVPLDNAADCRIIAFRPPDGGREHLAILIGELDLKQPVLTRMHSECFTGDLLASLRCDCGDQLRGAITEMTRQGGGIVLYLAQEGRGIGLVNKLRAYQLQDSGADTIEANLQLGFDADERLFLPAAEILRQLGIAKIRLMTNNPDKIAGLARWDIEVVERVPHTFPANPHNAGYLETKRSRAGHIF